MSDFDREKQKTQRMVEARSKSLELRKQAIESLKNNEITFHQLVEASFIPSNKYLGKLRLMAILEDAYGWPRRRSRAALIKNGFSDKDTIYSIRRSQPKVNTFSALPRMETSRWDLKPALGRKYPKEGTLEFVMDTLIEHGIDIGDLSAVKSMEREKLPPDEDTLARMAGEPMSLDNKFTHAELTPDEDDLFGSEEDELFDDDIEEDELFG